MKLDERCLRERESPPRAPEPPPTPPQELELRSHRCANENHSVWLLSPELTPLLWVGRAVSQTLLGLPGGRKGIICPWPEVSGSGDECEACG